MTRRAIIQCTLHTGGTELARDFTFIGDVVKVGTISSWLFTRGVPGFAGFECTSNGGRQFLRKKRSNRHIVPLYGKSDRLFTQGLKFETR